jgi:hypothetical protein
LQGKHFENVNEEEEDDGDHVEMFVEIVPSN